MAHIRYKMPLYTRRKLRLLFLIAREMLKKRCRCVCRSQNVFPSAVMCALRSSALQCSAMQCSAMQCSKEQCRAVKCTLCHRSNTNPNPAVRKILFHGTSYTLETALRLSTISNWRPYPFNCMKLHNLPLPFVPFTLMSWQVSFFVLLQLFFVLCTS